MSFNMFHVNAFIKNNTLFSGNPAAVCPLDDFFPDEILQKIASQNNLPETAFIVQNKDYFLIRWFAPKEEVDLCGHATLAAAHVIFNYLSPELRKIFFKSPKFKLEASRNDDLIELNFPSRAHQEVITPDLIKEAINIEPQVTLASDDYLVILDDQLQIENLSPNLDLLSKLDRRGVVFSAKGSKSDYVSRVFHPKLGIGEDPVCGSAHCELTPYWSDKLDKKTLLAHQLSARGGEILCTLKGNRVLLAGKCLTYMQGTYNITAF